MVETYRDLLVWQRAVDLTVNVYALTATLPRHEAFGLTSQMQRAAVSIASNIAEGNARDSTRDYLRFLSMVMGSIAELETQLIICQRLALTSDAAIRSLLEDLDDLGKMTRALRRSLTNRLS